MAATMVTKIACMVVVCMVVVTLTAHDVEGITCGEVVSNLTPCLGYLKTGKGLDSKCCSGVKALISLAQTPADRKTACSCIKNAAASYGIGAGSYAASLPGACGVRIPYKISPSTDCNKVK